MEFLRGSPGTFGTVGFRALKPCCSNMKDEEQRRRYPRVKSPKGLLVAWESGTQRSVSYMETLALGGLFIRTSHAPPLRSAVKLLLELPSGDVRAKAIVRRVAPDKGMGVEFIAMGPEDRARLNQTLRPLLPA